MNSARRSGSTKLAALKIMKTLSEATREDLSTSSPLSVSYVSNKRARIVKCKSESERPLSFAEYLA